MLYVWMAVFTAVAVALDQFTKYLTVCHIRVANPTTEHLAALGVANLQDSLPEKIEVIPGLFSFSHHHNMGAAWSSFAGMTWLFVGIFVVFAGFMIWEFPKKRMGFTTFERWCLVAVFAGGLGNIIDRIRLGFVVDMIETEFINFPVFNVADCFITCGCIALLVHLVFFNKKFWKDEKK